MATSRFDPAVLALRHALQGPRDRLALTKPKVTLLLLAFGAVAAVVAEAGLVAGGGEPGGGAAARLIAFCLLGFMAAGGAATLNHLFDRDLDALMERTRERPVASGRVTPRAALVQAALLLGVSLPAALLLLGPEAAAWMAVGVAVYGGLYTLVLKRRSRQNIVIGGLAGSCGVLAGWAVVQPGLAAAAWLLALLVFLWTPPHFWGLAIARDRDYRAARIPMLPQVRGIPAAASAMLAYAVAMWLVSLLLVPFSALGGRYLAAAILLGAAFCAQCWRTWREPTPRHAAAAFKLSGAYLALLLAAMWLDIML